ncbi:hypothetical protein AB3N04_13250 [Alkalihalophilus sp. As8PL]|uniref:PepSY domain-containing protein n=1 Tax=Alkalihalophilus sp. As8PL TaxID=3237103 RepID=A0AB39BQI5_9BACI
MKYLVHIGIIMSLLLTGCSQSTTTEEEPINEDPVVEEINEPEEELIEEDEMTEEEEPFTEPVEEIEVEEIEVEVDSEEVVEETESITEEETATDAEETDLPINSPNDQEDTSDTPHDNHITPPTDSVEDSVEEFVDGKLTEEGAIKRVKKFLEIQNWEDVHVVVDHESDGKYIVQVFDIMGNDVGHTMTRGWYTVDINTGEVKEML